MNQPKVVEGGSEEKNRYSDVVEMVRELVGDEEFAARFETHLKRREIVNYLMSLRGAAGLSQEDIAKKLRCSQSRVSKLERNTDSDLRLGDLVRYAGILGFETEILLTPKEWTVVDEIKYHAFCIKRSLDHLAGLARKDPAIAKGVVAFFDEAKVNIVRIIQDSAQTVIAALRAAWGEAWPPREECSPLRIERKKAEAVSTQDCHDAASPANVLC